MLKEFCDYCDKYIGVVFDGVEHSCCDSCGKHVCDEHGSECNKSETCDAFFCNDCMKNHVCKIETEEEAEEMHLRYFGENIRRVIKAFKKK